MFIKVIAEISVSSRSFIMTVYIVFHKRNITTYKPLFERKGFTRSQNSLLERVQFFVASLKWVFIAFSVRETHLLRFFLNFLLFSWLGFLFSLFLPYWMENKIVKIAIFQNQIFNAQAKDADYM